ncbi:hypothetical protein ANO11243_044340 [Dothideomycetidae sp. 11243]|nr:hypothetical protein ANO11243_044340 [fungal sp. No.11243]
MSAKPSADFIVGALASPTNGDGNMEEFDIYDIDLDLSPTSLTWRERLAGVKDSFREHPQSCKKRGKSFRSGGKSSNGEGSSRGLSISPLTRDLRGRHLQMIAIGGAIGTGLFVGSGTSLALGGPASLITSYSIVGILIYCTMQALGELSVIFPIAGSFSVYSTRFIDPAWGFAMGWNYALQWLTIFPLELVSASLVLRFWGVENVRPYTAIFLGFIAFVSLFGVRGYGEVEFLLSAVKIFAILGFISLGVIINIGGGPYSSGPYSGHIGTRFWHENTFINGFKGLGSTFLDSALAFAGTELVGLAAAEAKYPRRSIPTAIKQVFWRIVLFYLVSLTVVTFCVSSDDPRLLAKSSSVDARASPFVIAILNSGIEILPSFMNTVVLISVISVANSAVYGSTRTLAALSDQRQAPRILGYIDRKGRPIVANVVAVLFGLIGFFGSSPQSITAYQWLSAITTLSSIFTWGSICFAHIRFRKAWNSHGHSLDELPYVSQCGVLGSWLGVILAVAILIAQIWIGIWPLGYAKLTASQQAENFFSSGSLTILIVLISYVGFKIVRRTKFQAIHDMDLVTSRCKVSAEVLIEERLSRRDNWPRWRLIYKMFC